MTNEQQVLGFLMEIRFLAEYNPKIRNIYNISLSLYFMCF